MNKEEFYNKLEYLNLSVNKFSKKYKIDIDIINKWDNTTHPIPVHISILLISYEYTQKFQKLQREFLEISNNKNWKFQAHHQAMYDFVMNTKKYTEFKINDYDIILRVGNKDFGFMHLILRHYGNNSNGEIKALDILKIGNIIKQDVNIPTKVNGRVVFIQNKNNTKYTVILKKEKSGKLLFNFFSDK